MSDEKITRLVLPDRANTKATFKIVNKNIRFCTHSGLTVDEVNRIVQCASCGKTLDPFEWMLKTANKEQRIYEEAIRVDEETKVRRKAIVELKRIETNYKARIRTIKKKTNDPILNGIEKLIGVLRSQWREDDEIKIKNIIKYLSKVSCGEEV